MRFAAQVFRQSCADHRCDRGLPGRDGGRIRTVQGLSLIHIWEFAETYERLRKAEQLTRQEDRIRRKVSDTLEGYRQLEKAEHLDKEAAFDRVKEEFTKETDERERMIEKAANALDHAFDFMEDAFGDSQEMVAFVTELNTSYYLSLIHILA